jgi:diguanylate cyclase (GGDEF)-like protein
VTAVAIFDIDHFKSINDTYGHPAGDVVLREVVNRISVTIGEHGLVGRLGGEEFAVLFRGPLREAMAAARACIEAIPAETIELQGAQVTVSVSGGFAPWTPGASEDALESTYEAADRALYSAKQQGRRRLEVA